jgi:esterase/lipase superfamily enzyme
LKEATPSVALLYIHGYWSRFDGSLKVAAQIAYDLCFKGPVLAFSWASRGVLPGYAADEATIDSAAYHCKLALQLLERSGITRVYALAHSMGGRILSDVLFERSQHRASPKLEAALFAAPDMDTDAFRLKSNAHQVAANSVTLYASENDKAIGISRILHAAPRAGDARPIMICTGVDSVDASSIDTNWLSVGHGYHTKPALLTDIGAIFNGDPLPRNLGRIDSDPRGVYHEFKKSAP